jgi:ubiquinone/menaquinone biosynthesis C-methylase UbiE
MIKSILHRIVARPRAYEYVQNVFGARRICRRLTAVVGEHAQQHLVLDIGGGVGMYRDVWRNSAVRYICLDLDKTKLQGFATRHPQDPAVQADACRLPFRTGSVDTVVCTFVTHHLANPELELLLRESRRVVKPGGALILIDAVWSPHRWIGRLLWRYDRGGFPRAVNQLRGIVSALFQIAHQEQFCIYHTYWLCVGVNLRENVGYDQSAHLL